MRTMEIDWAANYKSPLPTIAASPSLVAFSAATAVLHHVPPSMLMVDMSATAAGEEVMMLLCKS